MAIAIPCRMNALQYQHQPSLDDATPAISVHQPLLDKTTRRRPSNLALNKHLRDSTVVFTMVPRQGLPDATARSDCSLPRSLIILDLLGPFLGLSPGLRPSWHQSRCNLLGLSSLNCGACKASESLVAVISWIFSSLYPDKKESAVVDVDHPHDMLVP